MGKNEAVLRQLLASVRAPQVSGYVPTSLLIAAAPFSERVDAGYGSNMSALFDAAVDVAADLLSEARHRDLVAA